MSTNTGTWYAGLSPRQPAAATPGRREKGVRIPDDISITGCHSTDLGATQAPPLTSIRTPIIEIGRTAPPRRGPSHKH